MTSYVLLTGGLGYIGSHTAIQLIEKGFQLVIIDNLSNSSLEVLNRIYKITKIKPLFELGDLQDPIFLNHVFGKYKISSVIHFAGLKDVTESLIKPNHYYANNVSGSRNLFEAMKNADVKTLIFSASANVYGNPLKTPIAENHPLNPNNPYGKSKWMVEQILQDLQNSNSEWKIIILRYFNPVGAHHSGLIGELSTPNSVNLMSILCKIGLKQDMPIEIYGNDYETLDGTPIRDFIHIDDLANGHVASLELLNKSNSPHDPFIINLGTGKPTTVLQMVQAFITVTGINIPYHFSQRRKGDISISYADPTLAYQTLGWEAKKGIIEMCKDTWRWKLYESNPSKSFD